MAFIQKSEELRNPRMDEDTLEGRGSQIEINKRMASGNNIMDRYEDFFLENEEDMEDSAPAPILKRSASTPSSKTVTFADEPSIKIFQKDEIIKPPTPQRRCSNHVMEPVDERTRMCFTCGAEEAYQPLKHAQGEVPSICGAPLKRKKGQCKSKPGKDGKCWRHSQQPRQQDDDDENIPIGGKITVKETMKELRQIAKDEGLRGFSRKSTNSSRRRPTGNLPAKRFSQRRS